MLSRPSLAQALGHRPITIVAGGIAGPRALTAADNAAGALGVKVLRASTGAAEAGTVRALDLKGLPLGEANFTFKSADTETTAEFDLPVEIRNDIARIDIVGERSAGAVAAPRQALEPPHRRHRLRRYRRHLAAARCRRATTSSARSVRSPTCGSRKTNRPPKR